MLRTITGIGASGSMSSDLLLINLGRRVPTIPLQKSLGHRLKGPLELFQYRSPDPDQSAYEVIERQQLLLERVKENVTRAQARQQRYYNLKRQQVTFEEGELVWIRAHSLSRAGDAFLAKLAPKWQGPAKVLMLTEPKQVTV